MRRNLLFKMLGLMLVSAFLMTACSSSGGSSAAPNASSSPSAQTSEMQYVSKEDLKADIEGGGSYIILDVRKAEDYGTSHIKGAFSADVDTSINGDDNETSAANLKAAIIESTGKDPGDSDSKFALVCYSGKRYATAATELMVEMGVSAENIYTLEGGNNGWSEAGEAYTSLSE